MDEEETYDVVVVGSGMAGAMTALRAAHHGLSVVIVEKMNKYGGAAAVAGGVLWIPGHDVNPTGDSREETMAYLSAITGPNVRRDRLEAYVDGAPAMIRFMTSLGIRFFNVSIADCFPGAPGARADRTLGVEALDGHTLGEKFPMLREQYTQLKLFGRYAVPMPDLMKIRSQGLGGMFTLLRIIAQYWLDFSSRRMGPRDRRLVMGGTLIGNLYKRIFDLGVRLLLDTKLEGLVVENGSVEGVEVSHFGNRRRIMARHGVMLAAGGFEGNQALRERYFPLPGSTQWVITPERASQGEGLLAAQALGAATEHTENAWWTPTTRTPIARSPNHDSLHICMDLGRPHGICVNRNGTRFADEAVQAHHFADAMIADQLKTGANAPCWHVFDAEFRKRFVSGGILPNAALPDRKIPQDWWDHHIFRADSIAELAGKIAVPVDALEKSVSSINDYAQTGHDPEFGRGAHAYNHRYGHHSAAPNPCLGTIAKPPFYAVPLHLGDVGTRGGLKADASARVLDKQDRPIPKLYAAGNQTGSPFGNCYPGPGSTLGPAAAFGFIAADHIAQRVGNIRGAERPRTPRHEREIDRS